MKYFLLLTLAFAGCTTGGDDDVPLGDAGPMAGDVGPMAGDAGPGVDAGPARPDAGPPTCFEPGGTIGDTCTASSDCNDGCFCSGVEACLDGVCVAGAASCDDMVACTTDRCDEVERTCAYEPDHGACADTDLCNGTEQCLPVAGCRPGL